MSRPSLTDLLPLSAVAPFNEVPESITEVRIISGRLDVTGLADGELSGGLLFEAKVGTRQVAGGWTRSYKWRAAGKPQRQDRERWPNWDGISDGDMVTRGHIEELKRGGWL